MYGTATKNGTTMVDYIITVSNDGTAYTAERAMVVIDTLCQDCTVENENELNCMPKVWVKRATNHLNDWAWYLCILHNIRLDASNQPDIYIIIYYMVSICGGLIFPSQ